MSITGWMYVLISLNQMVLSRRARVSHGMSRRLCHL